MTPTTVLPAAQAKEQTEVLRQRYGELVRAAAPEHTPAGLAELTASNQELQADVEQFRKGLEGSLVELPSGARILVGEYECLMQLARLNGVDEGKVLEGVKEVAGGRVIKLELGWMGLKDVTPLSGLRALTELGLSNNQITDITPLTHLTALTVLDPRNNQISDITPLIGLTALTELWLDSNQISDITPLAGLRALTELDLGDNQISDITPLSGLRALTRLWLFSNEISDITPLTHLTALTELGLSINKITDITPLSGLTRLTELQLWLNPLSGPSVEIAKGLRERGVKVEL